MIRGILKVEYQGFKSLNRVVGAHTRILLGTLRWDPESNLVAEFISPQKYTLSDL